MTKPRILIVEDDQDWEDVYRRALWGADYEISSTRKVGAAMALLEEQSFEVVITDLKMLGKGGEFSGFGVLERARAIDPNVQVIVITGYGSADHALRAMSNGAYDYITKGKDLRQKLALSVQSALEIRELRQEWLNNKFDNDIDVQADRIIGNSASMQSLFEQISLAAQSKANVLLRGEGGTGKRLIAQTIHRQSHYKNGPFMVVDCGRLSEAVLESELFGYETGIFYGKTKGQPGKFERAKGGTIFLENIGDLDVRLQTRLLGAVCDRVVERVGGQTTIPVDLRIIASTDKDLETMLASGQFQRHLFDALNEFVISVPPLRQRKDGDDIPALAAMFLQRHGQGRKVDFSPEAIDMLRRYNYPGNVRELESAIKYALTMTSDEVILPQHLRPEIRQYQPTKPNQMPQTEEAKDPETILQVCLLNLGGCSKKEEIMRLYSPRRVFVNVPDVQEYEEYEQIIRRTLEAYSLVPVLPKDYLEPVVMICNICKLIQTCKYSITDISLSETNVLYRLGQMHATGLHCAIFKDRRTNYTMELQGLFLLEYSNAKSLAAQLERWIENQVPEAKKSVVDMAQTEMDLPPREERVSLQRQLVQYKRNLLKLQEHRSNFIDPRSVPLDIQKNEVLLEQEIARIEHHLIAAI